jgi:hypothetical protein
MTDPSRSCWRRDEWRDQWRDQWRGATADIRSKDGRTAGATVDGRVRRGRRRRQLSIAAYGSEASPWLPSPLRLRKSTVARESTVAAGGTQSPIVRPRARVPTRTDAGGPRGSRGGRTASQPTLTSPSRHREGAPSTGHPASRTAATVAIQRWRTPNVPRGACRAHALSSAPRSACTRSPGTLRWMSAFGSRSATSDGRSSPASRTDSVSDDGPPAPSATQAARRPISSQVPSTSSPSGASRASSVAQAAPTSASGYCRSTLNARTTTGRRPPGSGSSKPPRTKLSPGPASGAAATTRAGSISTPTTSTSARTVRSRSRSSRTVTPLAP